jgi:Ser/Thr protein kinase RdoA (MazF antagonist)
MDPVALLSQLNEQRPAHLPAGEKVVREVQENVYQLRVGRQPFLVKWIATDNMRGQNELRIGRLFGRFDVVPAPRLIFEAPVEHGVIAGWEWIEGHDLREQGRDNLIEAFSRLGEFHRALRNQGEVSAPPNGRKFANISEMLAAETQRMCMPFEHGMRERCVEIVRQLEVGYPTMIHGDMHPGNIIATEKQVWFVDWSYACNSLNLFDLDYIQSYALPSSGPAWAQITPQEAVMVLPAYFQAAGMENVNYFQLHHAVMVWDLLRLYDNGMINGYRAELGQIRGQLEELLNKDLA